MTRTVWTTTRPYCTRPQNQRFPVTSARRIRFVQAGNHDSSLLMYMNQTPKPTQIGLMRHSMLVALALVAALAQPSGLLAQNPSCPVPIVPCSGNGQSSTIKFLVGGIPQNDVTVHVGDTLFYQVTVAVPADQSCAATNVDAFLETADGTVIQLLSHASIACNGGGSSCPVVPARINPSLSNYTVPARDVAN